MSASLDSASLPLRWGRYEVVRRLGEGGWGRVFEAALLGPAGFRKPVALKLLPEASDSTEAARALLDEARVGARLHHPHVVEVYDLGLHDGVPFVAMELVDGAPASALLARFGPFSGAALRDLGLHIAQALEHVHERRSDGQSLGLVHQDVKPSNILVSRDGRALLADFGLARARGLTRGRVADRVEGTLGYVAPEVFEGLVPTAAADVFALGVTLAELATGERLFGAKTLEASAFAMLDPEPRVREVADRVDAALPGLAPVVSACLARYPLERPTAAQLAVDLADLQGAGRRMRAWFDATPPPSRPSRSTLSVPRPGNAKPPADQFVGREDELRAAEDLLADGGGVITVVGPGGAGKTRFALELCARRAAGGWVVELEAITREVRVVRAVGAALGLDTVGTAVDDQANAVLLRALAARGPLLLVLDNAEQVLAPVASLVQGWTSACPALQIVVTSREPLGIREERLIRLGGLSTADAGALYRARCEAQDPDGVDGLLARLDGLPLAIELAAGLARMLPPAALVERLDAGEPVLRSRRRDLPARHASLDAAITWSWALLAPWEQAALLQLSVFEGGFRVADAEAVLDLEQWPEAPWALFVVEALLEKSLLRADTTDQEPRFAQWVAVRQWCRERFTDPTPVRLRHARWFARSGSSEALAGLHGPTAAQQVRLLVSQRPNLRAATDAAIAEAEGDAAADLACALCATASLVGPYSEGVRVAERVLSIDGLSDANRLRLRLALGHILVRTGDVDRLEELAIGSMALAFAAGDVASQARARDHRGIAALYRAQRAEALHHARAAVALARETDDRHLLARMLSNLSGALLASGDLAETAAVMQEGLELYEALRDRRGRAVAQSNLAAVHTLQGRRDQAIALIEAALAEARRSGSQREVAAGVLNRAMLLADVDSPLHRKEQQLASAEEAEELFVALGDEALAALAGCLRGLAFLRLGDQRGDALVAEQLDALRAHGSHSFVPNVLLELGRVRAWNGRFDEALAAFRAVQSGLGEDGDTTLLAHAAAAAARCLVRLGRDPAADIAQAEELIARSGLEPGSMAARDLAVARRVQPA